jgi:TolB protein
MRYILLLMILLTWVGCGGNSGDKSQPQESAPAETNAASGLLQQGEEKHLANIRQLTFGGENAEAYFSADGKMLSFQSTRDSFQCDQIYTMNADGSDIQIVSNGEGRTTCSFISPDGKKIIYASTYLASPDCPPPPDMSQGYVWSLYPGYDIFKADIDGSNLERLTDNPLYDAEAVYSPDGKKIVFTSLRDGDLDIYTMDPDGQNVNRVTSELGYDGGPFFSPDSKWICYRAGHPKDSTDVKEYLDLLSQNKIRPGKLEIYVIRPDGSERRQVTDLGGANFCPYFHPDGKRIIFSSNHHTGDMNFDLFMINTDGTGLEQITFDQDFDGFPMFSADGKKLVFASNRNQSKPGETNIFIADWIE